MAKHVSLIDFARSALALVREVERTGEPLTVTDAGRPLVRIAPHVSAAATFERFRGCVLRYDDPTEPIGD